MSEDKEKPKLEGPYKFKESEKLEVDQEPIIIEGREEPPVRAEPKQIDGPKIVGGTVRSGVRRYLGVAAASATIGLVSGILTGSFMEIYDGQITAYYAGDLNGDDQKQDFAIKRRCGEMLIYLEQEDGSYKRLKDIGAEMLSNVGDYVRDIREKAESKLKDIVE